MEYKISVITYITVKMTVEQFHIVFGCVQSAAANATDLRFAPIFTKLDKLRIEVSKKEPTLPVLMGPLSKLETQAIVDILHYKNQDNSNVPYYDMADCLKVFAYRTEAICYLGNTSMTKTIHTP